MKFRSGNSNDALTKESMNEEELKQFRTQICPNYASKSCPNANDCFYSHCPIWPRRNLDNVEYCSKLCKNVRFRRIKSQGSHAKMKLENSCMEGRICQYAHSKEEQLYHPEMYKSIPCTQYPHCQKFCPFIHPDDFIETITDCLPSPITPKELPPIVSPLSNLAESTDAISELLLLNSQYHTIAEHEMVEKEILSELWTRMRYAKGITQQKRKDRIKNYCNILKMTVLEFEKFIISGLHKS